MPFAYLETPNDDNNLLTAIVFAVLFPALQDEDLFVTQYEALFGPAKAAKILSLHNNLLAYSPAHKQLPSLNPQINEQLRPRLAKHLTDNQASLLSFFSSEEALIAESHTINEGAPIRNIQATAHILSAWLGASTRIYSNPEQTDFIDYPPTVNATNLIPLVLVNSQFYSLIDHTKLAPSIQTQLGCCLKQVAAAPYTQKDRDDLIGKLYRERLGRLLRGVFTENADHLAAIHGGYTLYLVPPETAFHQIMHAKNTIYIRANKNVLEYCIKENLSLIEGQLTEQELYYPITPSFSNAEARQCQTKILRILTSEGTIPSAVPTRFKDFLRPVSTPYLIQAGEKVLKLNIISEQHDSWELIANNHINVLPFQTVDRSTDWVSSMSKSAIVTGAFATARFDIAAIVNYLAMGTVEFGPLAFASLPFFLSSFLTGLGISIMGKHYAIEFEETIRRAKAHIDKKEYVSAMHCLDQEFLRWFGVRMTRHSFLTKEHYAIAHYLIGTCALDNEEFNKAYEEYVAAALDASETNQFSLLMITQLHKISLLKNHASKLQAALNGELPEEIIDQITSQLMHAFPDIFIDLYWEFHDTIAKISQQSLRPEPWNADEVELINDCITADGAYYLKHFSAGRGQLMGVFFSFFQSALLAAIHYPDEKHLYKPTITKLKEQLNLPLSTAPNEPPLSSLFFSIKKLRQCVELLFSFQQQHPELAENPRITACIATIKTFAQGLIIHKNQSKDAIDFDEDVQRILQVLNIRQEEINLGFKRVVESTIFLTNLALDFNQTSYNTIEDFLNAVMAPDNLVANWVSSKTGDTMLHRLATLPAIATLTPRIQDAAKCLKAFVYARNHRHETPLCLLQSSGDPHRLLAILDADKMIKLGDELTSVDAFLEKIKATPAIEGHFLLLDGPAGTGKTSSVQRHLVHQGYSITTWSRGEEKDSKVSGLAVRIKKFFNDAKKAAAETKQTHILFVDEIDQITPLSTGGAVDPQYHNKDDDTATFQTEITALRGHRVVLIAATNHPTRLAKPMLSRAATNRIHFPLPNQTQRSQLLDFFFRTKIIAKQDIEQLAKIAVAYSPRELQSFVDSIEERSISHSMMIAYFNKYARTLTTSFKEEYQCADLFMPSFETEDDLEKLFSSNAELTEQMNRLKSEVSIAGNKHTLLYGPPGSGKTTAVRMFAQNAGRVLIAIHADQNIAKEELKKVFERAKQLAPSIIFFDEIHNLAQHGTPHGTFIQTEMDGITKNDITIIAATNYPTRIESAILSRFTSKIELPRLSADALSKPIKMSLLEKINLYEAPIYIDPALQNELNTSPVQLSRECEGLSLRHISAAFGYLLGDLKRENTLNGITYLRLEDLCFSIVRMKVQEGVVERTPTLMTNTSYIEQNKHSFFPGAIPAGSIHTSALELCV